MQIFSKNTAIFAIITGAASLVAGCGGQGPNTYLMAKDAVAAKLDGAERVFTFAGRDERTIRAVGRSGDAVRVKVSYSTGTLKSVTCVAQVEAVDDKWTRVTPVCPDKANASEIVQSELNEMQIEEFVIAVLHDKPVDASMVFKRTSAVVIDNIGDITEEAQAEAKSSVRSQTVPAAAWNSDDGSGDLGSDGWAN